MKHVETHSSCSDPMTSTLPSGMSIAVEWYRRLIVDDAMRLKRDPAGAFGLYSHAW